MAAPLSRLQNIESLRPSDASANYTIIGSDNGLSPVRRQALIWLLDPWQQISVEFE